MWMPPTAGLRRQSVKAGDFSNHLDLAGAVQIGSAGRKSLFKDSLYLIMPIAQRIAMPDEIRDRKEHIGL